MMMPYCQQIKRTIPSVCPSHSRLVLKQLNTVENLQSLVVCLRSAGSVHSNVYSAWLLQGFRPQLRLDV